MLKWLQTKKNIAQKTAGLQEKAEATRRKVEVAMSILNERRKRSIDVEVDRRHLKLA